MRSIPLFATLVLLAGANVALAQSSVFKVGGGTPAQQLAQVESVTDFETFTGRTHKVTGSISFNPKTSQGSGKIVVDAASIDTGIPLRNDHMNSSTWLDTAQFPTITFETLNVRRTGTDKYKVYGKLTMKGVTKNITTEVSLKHRKASAETRGAGFKGDVVQVRTSFRVTLADYGITIPAPAKGKVAPTVTISLAVYGQTG